MKSEEMKGAERHLGNGNGIVVGSGYDCRATYELSLKHGGETGVFVD